MIDLFAIRTSDALLAKSLANRPGETRQLVDILESQFHAVMPNEEKPVSSPGYIPANLSITRHVDRNIGVTSITRDIVDRDLVDRDLALFVQDRAHNAHRRLDLVFSGSDTLHVRQGGNQPDRTVTTHSQIAHIIKEDHAGSTRSINRVTQQSPYHHVGTARLIHHGGPETIMLASKALQPLPKRPGAKVRTAAHYQPRWLPAGMGIDDPYPLGLPSHDFRSFGMQLNLIPGKGVRLILASTEREISRAPVVFYGYNMQSSI
jgi:hypothetical protein